VFLIAGFCQGETIAVNVRPVLLALTNIVYHVHLPQQHVTNLLRRITDGDEYYVIGC